MKIATILNLDFSIVIFTAINFQSKIFLSIYQGSTDITTILLLYV